MPTFNEQKGQGTFQPVLSEPGGRGVGGPTVPGSGVAVASTAIDGVSNILDILSSGARTEKPNEKLLANTSDLEAELVGELSLIADTPIPGGVVRQAGEDIDRLRQSFQQGRMSQTEMNTRLASITQRYISQDPVNAEAYRKLARNVLGVVPTQEILAAEQEQIQHELDQQREITQSFVDVSVDKYGIAIPDGRGGIDIEATAARGQELLQEEARINGLKQQIQMQKMLAEGDKARKLTEAEVKRIEFGNFQQAVTPLIDSVLEGQFNSIKLLRQGPTEGQSTEEFQRLLLEDTRQRRLLVESIVNDAAIEAGVSNTTREDMIKQATGVFESTTNAIQGNFEDIEDSLRAMEARGKSDIRRASPTIARLSDLGGRDAVNAVVVTAKNASTEVSQQLDEDVVRLITSQMDRMNSIMDGTSTSADLSSEERPAVARNGFAALEAMNRTPTAIQGQQKESFKNITSSLIQMTQDTPNPRDKATGVERLSTEFNLAALETLRANDKDVEVIGAALRDANADAFITNARRMEPNTPLMQQAKTILSLGRKKPEGFTAVYDAETGRIEIASIKADRSPIIVKDNIPSGIAKDVRRLNGNLDTIIRLADYGGNKELTKFTPNQIKQAFVLSTGSVDIVNQELMEEIPGGLAGFFGIQTQPEPDTETEAERRE
jgi:hypothetical protein